jgi:hypothetical protein
MTDFNFKIGDRVVVEVAGTVEVLQETKHGRKIIVQPHDPRAASVHASPQFVFPEDDDEPAGAEVILFPRGSALLNEVA